MDGAIISINSGIDNLLSTYLGLIFMVFNATNYEISHKYRGMTIFRTKVLLDRGVATGGGISVYIPSQNQAK